MRQSVTGRITSRLDITAALGFMKTITVESEEYSDRSVAPATRWSKFLQSWKVFFGLLGLLVLLAIGGGLMVPKIWKSTPDGFTPEIRISGIDLLQARSRAKSARALESAGQSLEAVLAWRSAITKNPGDPQLSEELILSILNQRNPPLGVMTAGTSQAMWLMRLSNTNQSSLDLASRILTKAELHEEVWSLLTSNNTHRSPVTAKSLAVAAFELGRMDPFRQTWLENQSAFQADPELQLYHAAWTALTGPAAAQTSAIHSLNQASHSEDRRILALRLRGRIEAQQQDSAALDITLKALEDVHGDRLSDHVRAWTLHHAMGHQAVAAAAARNYVSPPQSPSDASLLIGAWRQLGLHDLVGDFTRKQRLLFQQFPSLSLQVATVFVDDRNWEDLRTLAASLRLSSSPSTQGTSYANLLDGLAESGLGHAERAEEFLKDTIRNPPTDPSLTLEIAHLLNRRGHFQLVLDLIQPLESVLSSQPEYWRLLVTASHAQRHTRQLLTASKKGRELFPKDATLADAYAAALLILRQDSSEALRLTTDHRNTLNTPSGRIHHAFALIRHDRHAEARDLLNLIQFDTLGSDDRAFWHLAQFESAVASNDFARAREAYKNIEMGRLFPEQRDWIKTVLPKADPTRKSNGSPSPNRAGGI